MNYALKVNSTDTTLKPSFCSVIVYYLFNVIQGNIELNAQLV